MQFGLALPQYDFSVSGESPLRWSTVERWSDAAVAAGCRSLWVSDHVFLSVEKYGAPPGDHGCLDPVVAMSALATRHPEAAVGCLVFCAPLRAPRLLAKQVASIDDLGGREVIAGLGAGWFEPEFVAAGIPFGSPGERLRRLEETAIEVRRFLIGDGHWVPVWVGGRGDRLLRLVARVADGWNTVWAVEPDDYAARLDVLRRACDAAGRDPASITLSLGLTTLVGRDDADVRRRFERLRTLTPPGVLDGVEFDEWRAGRLVGTVEEVRDAIGRWGDLGVSTLVLNLGALPFSVTDTDDLDLVASAIT